MLYTSKLSHSVQPPDNLTIPQFILDSEDLATSKFPCIIDETNGRKIYLDELRQKTENLARAFKSTFGLGNGDIAALFSFNHIDYPTTIWAAHRLGAAIAPISPSLTVDELVYHLEIAKPSILIVHAEVLAVAVRAVLNVGIPTSRLVILGGSSPGFISLDNLYDAGPTLPPFTQVRLGPGEAKTKLAFLSFSSGTTGKPKAVAISHYNPICNVTQIASFNRLCEDYAPWEERRYRPGDVCSGVLPMYHIYGLVVNLHFILYAKMTLVLSQKFNFETFLDSIARFRITHLMIVPPQSLLLAKHPSAQRADLSSVRVVLIAAAPVTAELTQQLLDRMPNIQLGQGYGSTESCTAVAMFPISQKVGTLGSGGQIIPGTMTKVVKSDGTLAKHGESGELYVKGGQVTLGYYQNEEATKEAYTDDGWLRMGDEVLIQPNGDIFVLDRIKEFLKVKGNQVAPAELEGHLLGHSDVTDVGVVGRQDDYAGELPVAYVVLQPEIEAKVKKDAAVEAQVRERLFKHVSSSKANYKWLTGGIIFVDTIPKNASGKILRRVLREEAKKLPPLKSANRTAKL